MPDSYKGKRERKIERDRVKTATGYEEARNARRCPGTYLVSSRYVMASRQ